MRREILVLTKIYVVLYLVNKFNEVPLSYSFIIVRKDLAMGSKYLWLV